MGEWIPAKWKSRSGYEREGYRCKECGYKSRKRTPYCPFCGDPKNKRGDVRDDTR